MLAISAKASDAISLPTTRSSRRAAADVFVAPAAVELLDDRVLDAEVGPDGAITFALYTEGSMNGRQARLPTDIRQG
jgi:hypothetical protein